MEAIKNLEQLSPQEMIQIFKSANEILKVWCEEVKARGEHTEGTQIAKSADTNPHITGEISLFDGWSIGSHGQGVSGAYLAKKANQADGQSEFLYVSNDFYPAGSFDGKYFQIEDDQIVSEDLTAQEIEQHFVKLKQFLESYQQLNTAFGGFLWGALDKDLGQLNDLAINISGEIRRKLQEVSFQIADSLNLTTLLPEDQNRMEIYSTEFYRNQEPILQSLLTEIEKHVDLTPYKNQ